MMRDLAQWLAYIEQLHPKTMDLGLERLSRVVRPLHWHRFTCPVITIAGTNGKGSCARILESIFSAANYRVGVYTSPHLLHVTERIRINNQAITESTLLKAFEAVDTHRGLETLSFFEFMFVAALQVFQQAQLDLVILEVGLGGRLDAVNIVDADVAVITTIDLDHMEWLGSNRSAIAVEKAGIFRPNRPVVCGDTDPPDNLQQIADELNAPWYAINQAFTYQGNADQWEWHSHQNHWRQLPRLVLKRQNAATALMVVELLADRLPMTVSSIREGLRRATLSGRFEMVHYQNIPCYLDVAHNPQSAAWLSEQWQKIPVVGRRIAVFGMLADKNIADTVKYLLNYVDSWYLATLSVSRGATSESLQSVLKQQGVADSHIFPTVENALQAAIAKANGERDKILVFGSFHTVAATMNYFVSDH